MQAQNARQGQDVTHRIFATTLTIVTMVLTIATAAQGGTADPAASCDAAARRAARDNDVPYGLLQAITRVETGRGNPAKPWPWTINSSGRGHWFPTRTQAIDFARTEIAAGRSGFDLGCFQMNLRWHGHRFSSLDDMIDPRRNAQEAAHFLAELHARHGTWTAAAAAYHSQTPERAHGYLQRIASAMDQTLKEHPPIAGRSDTDGSPAPIRAPLAHRVNNYPLLSAGTTGAAGSVVPMRQAIRPLIGEP